MKALIIGATGDLGRAVAQVLSDDGWELFLHGFNNGSVLDELASIFGTDRTFAGDVRNEADIAEACARAAGHTRTLDALIYAAGINTSAATIEKTDLEIWQRTIDINLTGAFLATKLALPYLRLANPGRIVLVSSIFGIESPANRGAYSVSKHGLRGLIQSVAREEAPSVVINGVCPGPMWTESVRRIFTEHARERSMSLEDYVKERVKQIPAGRFLEVDECASTIAFLVSKRCQFVSGELIRITNGSAV